MQKALYKHGLLAGVAVFAVAIAAPIAANAQSARAQEARTQAQERRETSQQTAQAQQQRGQEARTQAQGRLEEAKLKACQKREKAIQNILTRLSDRSTKKLEVFTTISERVQAFYEEKGNTVSNYDELVAAVEAKKTAAEATVEAVNNDGTEFRCDGENPKGVAGSFKESLKAQNAALKEYKTAIKDLIVGVKSAQSTEATEGAESTEGAAEEGEQQ